MSVVKDWDRKRAGIVSLTAPISFLLFNGIFSFKIFTEEDKILLWICAALLVPGIILFFYI